MLKYQPTFTTSVGQRDHEVKMEQRHATMQEVSRKKNRAAFLALASQMPSDGYRLRAVFDKTVPACGTPFGTCTIDLAEQWRDGSQRQLFSLTLSTPEFERRSTEMREVADLVYAIASGNIVGDYAIAMTSKIIRTLWYPAAESTIRRELPLWHDHLCSAGIYTEAAKKAAKGSPAARGTKGRAAKAGKKKTSAAPSTGAAEEGE